MEGANEISGDSPEYQLGHPRCFPPEQDHWHYLYVGIARAMAGNIPGPICKATGDTGYRYMLKTRGGDVFYFEEAALSPDNKWAILKGVQTGYNVSTGKLNSEDCTDQSKTGALTMSALAHFSMRGLWIRMDEIAICGDWDH